MAYESIKIREVVDRSVSHVWSIPEFQPALFGSRRKSATWRSRFGWTTQSAVCSFGIAKTRQRRKSFATLNVRLSGLLMVSSAQPHCAFFSDGNHIGGPVQRSGIKL